LRLAARIVANALLVLGTGHFATAQTAPSVPSSTAEAVAFVNVNVIRMIQERVEPAQTVIVRGNRIAAIGALGSLRAPENAVVIDGSGRFLVPGLTDAHVHLATDMPWAPTRADFGDAPLYLAHGITTVINLRGSPVQLEWRRRIEAGELVGPTIYSSGEFVNEPRVNTPDQVAQEIAAQRKAGYDVIKFHEVWKPGVGFLTTTGLSRPAYLKMNDVARELGMPLVGHAPVNLGLETLLRARQPLSHLGMLSNIYFLPLGSNRVWLIVTVAAFTVLTIVVFTTAVAAGIRRWRPAASRPPRKNSRARPLAALAWLAGLVAAISAALVLPGGPLSESLALRLVFTSSILVAAIVSTIALVSTAVMWREAGSAAIARWRVTIASIAGFAFSTVGLLFWLPIAWRSSDAGIERLARRLHDAGISVQTTLVAYDAIGGPGRSTLIQDRGSEYLRADTRAIWQQAAQAATAPPGYRYTDFMKRVAGALNRAGVPLMAGTDAMGAALIAPGSSLHRELKLLTEGGLTPYEAIRAATVVPAVFLGKEAEFGTLGVGNRADLLLIDGNPLEDITRLKQPVGVMARGRWFTREQLQQMLAHLAREQ
jgi:hypothetical protein